LMRGGKGREKVSTGLNYGNIAQSKTKKL